MVNGYRAWKYRNFSTLFLSRGLLVHIQSRGARLTGTEKRCEDSLLVNDKTPADGKKHPLSFIPIVKYI